MVWFVRRQEKYYWGMKTGGESWSVNGPILSIITTKDGPSFPLSRWIEEGKKMRETKKNND